VTGTEYDDDGAAPMRTPRNERCPLGGGSRRLLTKAGFDLEELVWDDARTLPVDEELLRAWVECEGLLLGEVFSLEVGEPFSSVSKCTIICQLPST
jgi:hypothetical protein